MFEKIYSNENQKKLIESMIKNNRVPHTIILTGKKGLGKLTFAKEIAGQLVNKKNINNCVDIDILDANLSGSILISNIREIKNKINILPHEASKKVQIIANCDNMTVAAQNALLKSLEEPPLSTFFILTVTNINSLLDTILSRATIINMKPVSKNDAVKILSKEYPKINISNIIRYVKIFGGNIGLIKSILDNSSKVKENLVDSFENLLFYIITNNEFEVLKIFSKYKNNKIEFKYFLELFKIYFEKILKIYLTKQNISEVLINHHSEYFFGLETKIYISDLISKALEYLDSNINTNLFLTWFNINLFHYKKYKIKI